MAKKPMTKSQIVSHFAGKFELTKKTASGIVDEVAALAVSETKKSGSFTLPGIGKIASPTSAVISKGSVSHHYWHRGGATFSPAATFLLSM
jgi:hypothetical protein